MPGCSGRGTAIYIVETPTNFSIEWSARYHIDGDKFIVIEQPGRIRAIFGYPTAKIAQVVRQITN
jgi:hypothetical protein